MTTWELNKIIRLTKEQAAELGESAHKACLSQFVNGARAQESIIPMFIAAETERIRNQPIYRPISHMKLFREII